MEPDDFHPDGLPEHVGDNGFPIMVGGPEYRRGWTDGEHEGYGQGWGRGFNQAMAAMEHSNAMIAMSIRRRLARVRAFADVMDGPCDEIEELLEILSPTPKESPA